MKKLICLILALTLLVGMTAIAGAEGTASFVVSSAEAAPGEELTVTVALQNNPGVAGIEFDLVYDKDVLEWIGVEKGDYPGLYDMDVGISLTWFSMDLNRDEDAVFCTLIFRVKDDAPAGDTTVTLWYDEEEVYDWDEVNVYFDIVPGTVTVLGKEPVTLADGFYLIGQSGWTEEDIDPAQSFAPVSGSTDEYQLETGLAVGDEIKVVRVESGAITAWYPDGAGTQYTVDADHAGRRTVFFRPDYAEDRKAFGGFFAIDAPLTPMAEVFGVSLSLKGSVGLNCLLILPEELTKDAKAYVELNGTKLPVSEAKTRSAGDKTLYQFSTELHAKQMNDPVVLRAFGGDGKPCALCRYSDGAVLTDTGFVFAVKDYIKAIRENSKDEKLVALVNALSDVGSLAQEQFGYDTKKSARLQGEPSSVTAESLASCEAQVTPGTAKGVSFKDGSLALNSGTAIRLLFSLDKGKIGDYSFTLDGSEVTPEETPDGWLIEIPDVAARNLDKTHTVTVSSGEGQILTVKYSALSYAYSLAIRDVDGEDPLTNLVMGLVLYNRAADDYFA